MDVSAAYIRGGHATGDDRCKAMIGSVQSVTPFPNPRQVRLAFLATFNQIDLSAATFQR